MTRQELKEANFEALMNAKRLLKKRKEACAVWENRCDEIEVQLTTYENLMLVDDTPEMNHKLTKTYNKYRHYDYIYHKIVEECEELEEAIVGLEKADYWL